VEVLRILHDLGYIVHGADYMKVHQCLGVDIRVAAIHTDDMVLLVLIL
jgi:hypothetical protein